MNTATASQLPIDFPECPDVDGLTILRVVPPPEPHRWSGWRPCTDS
ncbi:MAG: hypothetical protein CM1200mP26_14020 [Acidimicrobiales bacterium]|nr:MAG: hypothetical protein CM1200mP26_14020 [Acidimicrobiales bacterium]